MPARTEKRDGDSLFWIVEKECLRIQALVAMSHAKRGGRTVLMTNRKMSEDQLDELLSCGVEAHPTR